MLAKDPVRMALGLGALVPCLALAGAAACGNGGGASQDNSGDTGTGAADATGRVDAAPDAVNASGGEASGAIDAAHDSTEAGDSHDATATDSADAPLRLDATPDVTPDVTTDAPTDAAAPSTVVLFGGQDLASTGYFLDDTWTWDGAAWTE
jgi:hypothetical protein